MNTISARPTSYRHVLTRSRLEARWLIFFDAIRVPWQYEPEDFSLPSRGYRPDLWLPSKECWAEIKPEYSPLDHQLAAAVQEQTGSPLLWISGRPQLGGYTVSFCDFGTVEVVTDLQFALGGRGDLWLADAEQTCCLPLPPRWMEYQDDFPLLDAAPLLAAYRRAMSWRFG